MRKHDNNKFYNQPKVNLTFSSLKKMPILNSLVFQCQHRVVNYGSRFKKSVILDKFRRFKGWSYQFFNQGKWELDAPSGNNFDPFTPVVKCPFLWNHCTFLSTVNFNSRNYVVVLTFNWVQIPLVQGGLEQERNSLSSKGILSGSFFLMFRLDLILWMDDWFYNK